MPDTAIKKEDARILAWRETRERAAEVDRDERLRKRDEARAKVEVERKRIQRDTARALLPQEDALIVAHKQLRRQRFKRATWFWLQFSVCVLAPVVAAAWYLIVIATPLHEARTVIAITKPNSPEGGQSTGILGQIGGIGELREIFMANEYVHSQALMDQLEAELSLETRFSGDEIDPIYRLRSVAGVPITTRQQFDRFVESSVNVQTGLLTIYVRDPDQNLAVQTSNAIIRSTAQQINALNDTVLDQRLSLARQSVGNSAAELLAARTDLIAGQIRNGEIDPQRSIAGLYDTIQALEAEALALGNTIRRAQISGAGEGRGAQQDIALHQYLQQEIDALQTRLVNPADGRDRSLNEMLMENEMAKLRVDLANETHTAALSALVSAEDAGVLGRSVFQVVVPPRTAAQAVFPKTPSLVTLVAIIALAIFAFIRLFGAGRRNMA